MTKAQNVRSNLLLKSNLMVASRFKREGGWKSFAPADLLIKIFPEYLDVRTERFLTPQQLEQKKKMLFVAEKIIDID